MSKKFVWKTRENVGVLSKLNFWTKFGLFEMCDEKSNISSRRVFRCIRKKKRELWTCPQAVYSLRKREKFDSCVLPLFFSNCDLSVFLKPKKSAWKAINSANFEGFASSKIDDQDRKKKKDKASQPEASKASNLNYTTPQITLLRH